MRKAGLNEHVRAGRRLWSSKLVVHHFDKAQMRALVANIEQIVEHGLSIAVCIRPNKKKIQRCFGASGSFIDVRVCPAALH